MRILFISDNFPPEVNAPAVRTFEHCKQWVHKGHQVTVITCVPNFPQGKVHEGYRNKLYQTEYVEGIKVVRVWSFITANQGFLKRAIDFGSFAVMAVLAGLRQPTDLIIATSPQFLAAISGAVLSKLKFRPWVMEVRDLWPESIKAVGAMSGDSWGYKLLETLEYRMYRSANRIVVVTDSFKKSIAGLGIEQEKIEVVKNGVMLDHFQPREKNESILSQLNLKDKFIVAYIGTHGMAHKLDFILNAAKQVEHSDIHFLFIGDGAEKENLVKQKRSLQLRNVTLHPPVPKQEIARYLSIIDVALVNLKKSDTFKTVIPSKIFENAAMGKPILLGVEGESKALIEKYNAGRAYLPENEEDFFEAIIGII